jgi:M6 family metalloprotease-like protein
MAMRRSLVTAPVVLAFLWQVPSAQAQPIWELSVDRPGSNLPGTPFPIDKNKEGFVAVIQCQDACKDNPACKAYTYVKPGIQGVHGYCWLKGAVPAAVTNNCCTSGVVRPVSSADRCANYAATAMQQVQSNVVSSCNYTGARWVSDYQQHYNWCMGASAALADSETSERQRLLGLCWTGSFSTSGDLSAHDWCYDINHDAGQLTIYPIIQNIGPGVWKSQKDGYYKVGGTVNSVSTEQTYPLLSHPYWSLKRFEMAKLLGMTLPYHPRNYYRVINPWVLSHPEDVNASNNSNPGLTGYYSGASFESDGNLLSYSCRYLGGGDFVRPAFGLKPVVGRRNVLAILWDPKRPTDPALPTTTVDNVIFGQQGASARAYFLENSGGLFTIDRAGVLGWYSADKPASHYWRSSKTPCEHGFKEGHLEKWAEAVRKADGDFDYAKYDVNQDGYLSPDELTVLIVIPQNRAFGTQRDAVGREVPLESLVVDGVRIDKIVEAYIGSPASIGLVAHELSHILLNAGDMYFSFFQPYAAGPYSLMDSSPANPPHLDPVHKLKLGWIKPRVILQDGQYDIENIETGHEAYILYRPERGTREYFVVENRWGGTSYDQNLPSFGLAVWHVMEDESVYGSLPTPASVSASDWTDAKWQGWARKGIAMIRPIYGPPYNAALWDATSPQTGYDLLSTDSNSNHVTLRWADGTASGFGIRAIPSAGAVMRVTIETQ